jgi:hypothetical protein
MTTTPIISAEERARSEWELFGDTPEARRTSARIVVKVAHLKGEKPIQWVLDVAEGRLSA